MSSEATAPPHLDQTTPERRADGIRMSALLWPMALAFVVLIGTAGASLTVMLRNHLDSEIRRLAAHAGLAKDAVIDRERSSLTGLLEIIARQPAFQVAFLKRDREALLQAAEPMFAILKRSHRVTHFYFIEPDRRMFLRVHQPPRYGDVIDRKTLLETERTGQIRAGTELGVLGTVTLRVVMPWVVDGALIGYLELGMEIDQALAEIHQLMHIGSFLLIDKAAVSRETWASGMQTFGRAADWDRLPEQLLVATTGKVEPAVLDHLVVDADGYAGGRELALNGRRYRFARLPFDAAAGAGTTLWISRDVTVASDEARHALTTLVGTTVGIGVLLLGLAAFVLRRARRSLSATERVRDVLSDQVRHDALTGLFNQRSFYENLRDQLHRAEASGCELAVLMIDIDHFKSVNDTFGHRTGDAVLKAIAADIRSQVRPHDLVARYGGEEFSVLLPAADAEEAIRIGERIRAKVEAHPIVAEGNTVCVTLSAGVAAWQPTAATTAETLVGNADRALYAAKNSGRNRLQLFCR